MSLATLKNNRSTKRIILIRIEPGRFINDDLTASGNLYSMSFLFPVAKLERNGVELTKVTDEPNADGEWRYTESTSTLEVYTTSAPSGSTAFILYYYIFITNDVSRSLPQDPESVESVSNPLRDWEPRLDGGFKTSQSVKDLLQGVFTVESSILDLFNPDADFQKYLTASDSFHNKTMVVWVGLDSTDNLQKVFEGECKKVSGDNKTVTLETYDPLSLLDRPCLMGDSQDEAYFTENGFANIDPQKRDEPCPLVYGPYSRHYAVARDQNGDSQFKIIATDNWNEAVCTDYSETPSTTTARVWGLCRTTDGLRSLNIASPTSITYYSDSFDLVYSVGEWAKLDYAIFNKLEITDGVDTDKGFLVSRDSSTRTLTFATPDSVDNTAAIGGLTLNKPTTNVVIAVKRVDQPDVFAVLDPVDYTVTTSATSGDNYYTYVTFGNGFESSYSNNLFGNNPLHPSTHVVTYYLAPVVTNHNHADVLSDMLSKVGLTADTTTFAASKSSLNTLCQFSIPQFDELDFGSYRDYMSLILGSTFGIVYLNNSFEVEYTLLSSPSSSDILNEDTYLLDSLRFDVEYQDIVTSLIGFNPHNNYQLVVSPYTANGSTTVSSNKAKYLHDIDRPSRFRHVLNDISGRLQTILNYRSNRSATYKFDTSTVNLDSQVGDDLQLESSHLLGQQSSKDVKILALDKDIDLVHVIITDLEGI